MKQISIARYTALSRRQSRGFSLVELMVGLTIGMVVVAGLALLFANTSRSGNELEKSVRQIESGRYAVELLHDDIALAGFYGEVPTDYLSYTIPDVCATALVNLGWDKTTPSNPKVPAPIIGLTATELDALPTSCLSNHKSGTAGFSVHRLGADLVAPAAMAASAPYVQTSRCTTDPVADPFIVSSTAAAFTLKNRQCSGVNSIRSYVSRIYTLPAAMNAALITRRP